jgi:hypothetical protein
MARGCEFVGSVRDRRVRQPAVGQVLPAADSSAMRTGSLVQMSVVEVDRMMREVCAEI